MGNKDSVLQMLGLCVLIAAADHGVADTEAAIVITTPLIVASPSPSAEVTSRGLKELVLFFSFIFLFFPFWEPDIKD